MYPGHGESSQKFYHKTRTLTESLRTAFFSSHHPRPVEFIYLDAVHDSEPCTPDSRTWGFGDHQVDRIRGLEKSIKFVLGVLGERGPFDGILGFSTGGAVAVILASLLEGEHDFRQQQRLLLNLDDEKKPQTKWRGSVFNIPLTPSPSNNHPPLRFVLAYSAFMLGHPMYTPLYTPSLKTPILHYFCELDPIIPAPLTKELCARCENGVIRSVYGTHFVPRTKESFLVLERFIKKVIGFDTGNETGSEDGCCAIG
ncbi:hypothetical protein BDV06DRAFT_186130 [Aspergillus oleicola]